MTPCSAEGCDRDPVAKGLCRKHYQRGKERGITNLASPTSGVSAYQWVDTPGYDTLHARIRRYRGKASAHLCEECGERQARQWSYDYTDPNELIDQTMRFPDMRYSLDLDRYRALCRSCHAKLDFSNTEKRNKAVLTVEQVREIKSRITDERGILTELANEYGVGVGTISHIKHGRNWAWVQ